MENCDVAIVGGGPAGSSCAWRLRRAGVDAVVIDKATFPRDKVCAGWVTPPILDSLEFDIDDYTRELRTFQPFTGFVTGLIGGPDVVTDYPRPVSYGIRRCEFDAYLLQRSGARLWLGEALQSLHAEPDGWVMNGKLRTPLVIGAGGHFCPVARMLSAVDPQRDDPTVLAQEVEFELPAEHREGYPVSGERPELYFCPDLAGYGWIVRKGHYLNIGIGREHERNLSSHLDAFLTFLRERGKLTIEIPKPFHGHAYKLRRHAPRVQVPDRVLLIGDAAGLAYPQSGEGIRPAIESGLMAAELILEAGGHYAGSLGQRYRERCDHRFGPGASRTKLVPASLRQWAASKLMQTGWFSRHVLLDRWFLHAHQAAL